MQVKNVIYGQALRGPLVGLIFLVMALVTLLWFELWVGPLQNKATESDGNRLTYLDS